MLGKYQKYIQTIFAPCVFALAGSLWIVLLYLADPLLTRRKMILFLLVFGLLYVLSRRLFLKFLKSGSELAQVRKYLMLAVLLAAPLSLAWPGTLAYLQTRTLHITALPGNGEVVFLGLNSGDLDIPHAQIQADGAWEYVNRQFIARSNGVLTWTGRTSSQPVLFFQGGPGMGKVHVRWDTQEMEYSLFSPQNEQIRFQTPVPVTLISKLIYFLSSLLFMIFLFLLLILYTAALRLTPDRPFGKGFWLRFSLPVMITGLFMLLVFYPGMMSGDSLAQWTQAHGLPISDQHPAFHTLFIRLITRIWDSPAAIVAAQILGLALVVAWGVGNLVKRGLPESAGWLISFLFALSPVNGLYVVTIWKDIPYALSLLWLSILCVEIVLTNGAWLARINNLIAFIICALFVSLFRHNGFPVIILTLLLLLVVYQKHYRRTAAVLGILLVSRWLITGTIYRMFQVMPMPPNYQYALILHHIGAHINSGSPLSADARSTVEQLMPLEAWEYSDCSVDPIVWNPRLDVKPLQSDPARYIGIAFSLFIHDPIPDLKATLNLGSLIYAFHPNCREYVTPLYYKPSSALGATWIDFKVNGVEGEKPVLPTLVAPVARFYALTLSSDAQRVFNFLFWRPVVYLITLILSFMVILRIDKQWRILCVAAPAVIQSLVLLIVNVSQDIRYQYGVYLVAIYSVGLLMWTVCKRSSRG